MTTREEAFAYLLNAYESHGRYLEKTTKTADWISKPSQKARTWIRTTCTCRMGSGICPKNKVFSEMFPEGFEGPGTRDTQYPIPKGSMSFVRGTNVPGTDPGRIGSPNSYSRTRDASKDAGSVRGTKLSDTDVGIHTHSYLIPRQY